MASLPVFDCPVCRNPLSWDIVFAHQGVREAMLALVNAHADGQKLLRPLLGYITLFAPKKTAMRYERIATLANELVAMIRVAQIERDGRIWPAPASYWQQAFDEVIARHHAGTLRTPLASHGYLFEILVGYASKAESRAETAHEAQRAGHAGTGTAAERRDGIQTGGPIKVDATLPKARMPDEVRAALGKMKRTTHA
ncbi:MAG TPA: hypothetical protein VJ603_00735 [Paucimonas sp.]|nr:hypothetical protein [Paucimonas sp.]